MLYPFLDKGIFERRSCILRLKFPMSQNWTPNTLKMVLINRKLGEVLIHKYKFLWTLFVVLTKPLNSLKVTWTEFQNTVKSEEFWSAKKH